MINRVLAPYKGREDLTIDDLVHLAAEVLPQVVSRQWRHKVTEVPDARTIRYYIQEGLVDRPGGAAGPAALYGYRHLLQIVAIKALQSEFVPIREIKKTIGALSQQEMEARLEEWAARRPREQVGRAQGAADRSRAARDSAWTPAWRAMLREGEAPYNEDSPEESGAARRYLLGLRRRQADTDPEAAEAGASEPAPTGWRRYELFPGIELHVKEGTPIPDSPSFLSVLASRLRVTLEHLRKAALSR